jgi:hypothetical protein
MGGKRNYLFGQPTINPLEQKAFRLFRIQSRIKDLFTFCRGVSRVEREKCDFCQSFSSIFWSLEELGDQCIFVFALLRMPSAPNAGIFKQSMEAWNRVGIELSYRPARLHRLPELIPWNRFLGSLKV